MAAPVAILLAAGEREPFSTPPFTWPLCGRPLGSYVLAALREAGVERILVISEASEEALRPVLGPEVAYVPEGEGALGHALARLQGEDGPVLLFEAELPLLRGRAVDELLKSYADGGAAGVALRPRLAQPVGGAFPREVLERVATKGSHRRRADRDPHPYLRNAIGWPGTRPWALYHEPERGMTEEAVWPVRDAYFWSHTAAALRRRIVSDHLGRDVAIVDPESTYLDADVEIEPGAIIHPQTFLHGQTFIGRGAEIGPLARLTNARIGAGSVVHCSVIVDSEVGEECRVGPYAHLRMNCRLGNRVKVGNFVELKKAEVEDGASIAHLSYVGDAEVGEKTNIGAGTITCNYDGKKKHRTKIGRGAFVGSNSTLVAPVEIGDGAYVAAGSPVTEDVPPDSLAIARSRQTNKEGWARRRREEGG